MATSSFNKHFVVTDQESIERLKTDLNTPRKVTINSYDRHTENKKGSQLLKQQLLKLNKN